MTGEYTKGPWPEIEHDNGVGPNDESFWEWWEIPEIAQFNKEENAIRARACVNALEGIDDPEKAVKNLVARAKDVVDTLGENRLPDKHGYLEDDIHDLRTALKPWKKEQ